MHRAVASVAFVRRTANGENNKVTQVKWQSASVVGPRLVHGLSHLRKLHVPVEGSGGERACYTGSEELGLISKQSPSLPIAACRSPLLPVGARWQRVSREHRLFFAAVEVSSQSGRTCSSPASPVAVNASDPRLWRPLDHARSSSHVPRTGFRSIVHSVRLLKEPEDHKCSSFW